MTRLLLLAAVCALVVVVPAPAVAHPGHDHTVMGTVKSLKDGHLEIVAKDGKVSTFMIGEATKILRGKAKAPASDIKVGERVVAIGSAPPAAAAHAPGAHDAAAMLTAKEIRLAAASAPAAKAGRSQ